MKLLKMDSPPASPGKRDLEYEAKVANTTNEIIHPLKALTEELYKARAEGQTKKQVADHGTWRGTWPTPSRSHVEALLAGGRLHRCSDDAGQRWRDDWCESEVNAVTARRELHWSKMTPDAKTSFQAATDKHWQTWLDNDAATVYDAKLSRQIEKRLETLGKTSEIMEGRILLTDKNDGKRTEGQWMPLEASARFIIPGYKIADSYNGTLRKDAPTACRSAQTVFLCWTGSKPEWSFGCGDVRAAFLKGILYDKAVLLIRAPDGRRGPVIPGVAAGQLIEVRKRVFGQSDAPRWWYVRFAGPCVKHGWTKSSWEPAMFLFIKPNGVLGGILLVHVDDVMFGGDKEATAALLALGEELGFGTLVWNEFDWCGKHYQRLPNGNIKVDMVTYHENLPLVPVPRSRRQELDSPVTPYEQRCLDRGTGCLGWLVAQLRVDLCQGTSCLQAAARAGKATVETLITLNAIVSDAKKTKDFALVYGGLDLETFGLVTVHDSALGNVDEDGAIDVAPEEKVHSQAGYLIMGMEDAALDGKTGLLNLLDWRSYREPRVVNSSFQGETYCMDSAVDAMQFMRGAIAELRTCVVDPRKVDSLKSSVRALAVGDARDCYDKVVKETSSFGSRKSMAFTVAALRQVFHGDDKMDIRWTATENMLTDALTKPMSLDHIRSIMKGRKWCIKYDEQFLKAKRTKKAAPGATPAKGALLGVQVGTDMITLLDDLAKAPGWHNRSSLSYQVARRGASYRTPEPRLAALDYPVRSSYGRFETTRGLEWRQLEQKVSYLELSNQHMKLVMPTETLVTVYSKRVG